MTKASSERSEAIWWQGISKVLLHVVAIVISAFLMVNVHEIGHTVFARLFGDNHATYALYRLQSNGKLACVGCNAYDETALSWIGNVVVTVGGVVFSQSLALGVLWYGKQKRCWRYCRILVAVSAFDVVFQVLQGVIANTAKQTGLTRVDIADFVWLVAGRAGISDVVIKVSIVAILLVYLWWLVPAYCRAGVLSESGL